MQLKFFGFLLTITPLVVYTGLAFPQSYPRWIFFAICTTLALLSYLFLKTKKDSTIHINRIDLAFILFVSVIVLTSFFGVSPTHSFWSSFERSTGAGFWVIILGAHFVYKILWHGEQRNIQKLWQFFVAVTILMSLWGIAQKIFPGFTVSFSGDRVGGTLGNAIFFGMYLVLALALLGFQFVHNKKFLGPSTYLILLIAVPLNLLALILTRSRGPLIACICGAVLFCFGLLKNNVRQKKYFTLKFCGVIILLFCIVAGFVRFGKISLQTTTLSTRSIFWSMAWHGFLKRPLLGWGPENYAASVDAVFEPRLSQLSFGETYPDKPHNAQLETLVTSGIVGAGSYVLFILALFFAILHLYRNKKFSTAATFGAIAFLCAHEIQNASAFETLGPLLVFIFFTSWISHEYDTLKNSEPRNNVAQTTFVFLTIFSVVITIQTLLHFSETRALAELWNAPAQNITAQLVPIKKLVSTIESPFYFEEWQAISEIIVGQYWQQPQKILTFTPENQRAWNEAKNLLESQTTLMLQTHLTDAGVQLSGGKTFAELFYITLTPAHASAAVAALIQAHENAPQRSEPLIVLAQLSFKQNNLDDALHYMNEAIKIDATFPFARWYRGLIFLIQKNYATAASDILFALDHGYRIENAASERALAQEFITHNLPDVAAQMYAHKQN